MSFACVKEADWHSMPIPDGSRYAIIKIFFRPIESFYWAFATYKKIREFDPDVVLATYAHTTGFIGAIASMLAKRTFVVHVVGSDLRFQARTLLGRLMVSLIFRKSSGVVCVSRDLQTIAMQLGAKHTTVIPDPVDTCNCENSKLVKRKSNLIISVSSLIPLKGLSYLVIAMKRISDCRLVVIGEGGERKKLETLSQELGLSNRVFFVGWMDHGSEFWDYLKEATLFVLPSTSEGTPRAIIEAMACGLPIVSTRVGGIPEIIKDGVNGFLVSPRNEEQLVGAIQRVLDDETFRKNASEINREKAKRYSNDIIGLELSNYLKMCISV